MTKFKRSRNASNNWRKHFNACFPWFSTSCFESTCAFIRLFKKLSLAFKFSPNTFVACILISMLSNSTCLVAQLLPLSVQKLYALTEDWDIICTDIYRQGLLQQRELCKVICPSFNSILQLLKRSSEGKKTSLLTNKNLNVKKHEDKHCYAAELKLRSRPTISSRLFQPHLKEKANTNPTHNNIFIY